MGGLESGWGLDVILWFQSWRTPLIASLGQFFAVLGSEDFYIALLPLIYWSVDATLGRRLGPLLLIQFWVNGALKNLFARPRPFMVDSRVQPPGHEVSGSYGIPSGHTQGAVVTGGGIAVELKRRWITIAAVIYIILMGVARMVIGVHYPQDVLGGLLVGGVLLGLYAWLGPRIEEWLAARSLLEQIGVVAATTVVMLVLHPLVVVPTSPAMVEPAIPWGDLISGSGTAIGAFLGVGIGYALERHYVRFTTDGTWWQRALRFVLGIAVLMGIRYGLGALFGMFGAPLVFRLIRYTLIGLWAGVGAPWLFVKLNIAQREDATADA